MPIVGPLPYNIQDGQLEDAVPVMGNFSWIVSQVNANSTPTPTGVGVWTPAISFGGASVGVTYGFRAGNYQTVGNLVFFAFDLLLTSKGSSTGTLEISGLPFPINSAWPTGGQNASSIGLSNATYGSDYNVLSISAGTSFLTIIGITSGIATVVFDDTNSTNTTEFFGTGFYPT